jgi:hypothetical protein
MRPGRLDYSPAGGGWATLSLACGMIALYFWVNTLIGDYLYSTMQP